MGVGAGNEKAVEVLGFQGRAQVPQARGSERGIGGVFKGLEESLEHFQFCKAICRFGKPISQENCIMRLIPSNGNRPKAVIRWGFPRMAVRDIVAWHRSGSGFA
jgi:hypothetical protein